MGPPRRARRGDGGRRLSDGPAQGRRDHRPAGRHRDAMVFHAGTAPRAASVTTGGRVLCVTALGEHGQGGAAARLRPARGIRFDGAQYRRDIGHRAARCCCAWSGASPTVRASSCWACSSASSARCEAEDGRPFVRDAWSKAPGEPLQGDGISRLILEDGNVLERGGCGFSHVRGPALPPSATQHRPELAGRAVRGDGRVAGVPPAQPLRAHGAHERAHARRAAAGAPPVCWFGGGMDLTPYYGFEEDAVHFHRTCRDALAPFGADKYPRFKRWCDEYFFLKHRNEPRGIGGIFFDDFAELGFERSFAMMQRGGRRASSPPTCRSCSGARTRPTASASATSSAYRRGRYVEFNLVWDRGTHVRPAVGRAHRVDPDVDAAAWRPGLRLAARARQRPRRGCYSDFLRAQDWVLSHALAAASACSAAASIRRNGAHVALARAALAQLRARRAVRLSHRPRLAEGARCRRRAPRWRWRGWLRRRAALRGGRARAAARGPTYTRGHAARTAAPRARRAAGPADGRGPGRGLHQLARLAGTARAGTWPVRGRARLGRRPDAALRAARRARGTLPPAGDARERHRHPCRGAAGRTSPIWLRQPLPAILNPTISTDPPDDD